MDTLVEVTCVAFNQDQTCIAVGMASGFRIYNTYPLEFFYHRGIS